MFKPLQRVNFKLLSKGAYGTFRDCSIGQVYEGVFIPNGHYEVCEGARVDDSGGLSFIDDSGDICTLSIEGNSDQIEIIH